MFYKRSSTTGSQEVVGTQDMLFSTEYARALTEGKAPLKKILLVLILHTPSKCLIAKRLGLPLTLKSSLKFYKKKCNQLKIKIQPIYFCSFVDGVLKSTLLNNVKNWGKYEDQFNRYDRCIIRPVRLQNFIN